MSEKHKKHQKRDSLTELENFIDSYAAEEETDDDDEAEDDEQQRMINLLKQQMMTNLTLMNNLSKQTGIPNRFPMPGPAAAAMPNQLPLLQNMMMPGLMPMATNPAANLLANPLANPLLGLQRMQQPTAVDPKGMTNMLNMANQLNALKMPMMNPMFQAQPVPKTEMNNNPSPYPTVMIPGVGPCVMIPNTEKTSNEKAADDLKKRLESVDGENKVMARRSSIDTSNFPKEILRGSTEQRRRSSTKSDDVKEATVLIKSKVKKEKVKESTRRVITIKENPEQEYAPKERRKSKSSDKKLILEDKKKEKVKGGHQVYVPPLRRGSEDHEALPPLGVTTPPAMNDHQSSSPPKPIKSILKKRGGEEKKKPEKKLEQDRKVQREHKEITSFVAILEKLGTDDSELDNIADLIIKKSIRKHSQVTRLIVECVNIIEKKPKFRTTFLQQLQAAHNERKQLRHDNRDNFLVYLTLKTSDGKTLHVLVVPIKEGITEMLNDAHFNELEARFLCDSMIQLGPVLTNDNPDALDMIMTTARAVSIHVAKITPEARKYLLKLVELYAHCWAPLDSETASFFEK